MSAASALRKPSASCLILLISSDPDFVGDDPALGISPPPVEMPHCEEVETVEFDRGELASVIPTSSSYANLPSSLLPLTFPRSIRPLRVLSGIGERVEPEDEGA